MLRSSEAPEHEHSYGLGTGGNVIMVWAWGLWLPHSLNRERYGLSMDALVVAATKQ